MVLLRLARASRVAVSASALALPLPPLAAEQQRPLPPPAARELPRQVPRGDAERGRYLAHHVAMCVECHSPRDPAGEIIAGEEFTGAPLPVEPPGPSWAVRVPRNRGLPGYTDAEGVRLLTQGGIDREGRQLRPPMPRFRMTAQDAADVVAYLKSLR